MKIIEIIISPAGQTQVSTQGFVGAECKAASLFLETALGQRTSEQLTAAYFQTQPNQNTAREHS